ncbi:MFS transporter [Fictibacillus sp. WQ 8-8]|uniref:MFS transporter n=1 Tax=Fictibacillus sp. WQ 8-8 TaxID=2938788 RepID=UPI002109A757|nr:MFS transporter [Fictibacillus sp. WQ 8-8]MCQ6265113.1 MFS transporter [Fictibacillus sp. WQ 8-8]
MEMEKVVQMPAAEKPVLWKNKNFMLLFITGLIFSVGGKIYELALPLILYDFTHSSVAMSNMRAIEFLPNLLLAMFIGVLVDRVNKKHWSLWTIGIQSVVLFGLFLALQMGYHSLPLFYVCGFLLMTCSYAFFNARYSMVKQVLPNELLTPANASFSFVTTLIGIMGPAITGFILMLSSLHDGLLLTSVAFFVTFLFLLKLDHKEVVVRKKQHFLEDLKEGWIALRENRPLWLITILVVFINSTSGMVDTMIVFFAKDELRLTTSELGLTLSFAGVGGLAGSSMVSILRRKVKLGKLLGLTTFGSGLGYFILFLAHTSLLLATGLFFEGLFGTISSVCIWTFRQETTPQHLIGRIGGLTGSIFKLGMPLAIVAAGWIAKFSHPGTVFWIAALANVLIFLAYWRSSLWRV